MSNDPEHSRVRAYAARQNPVGPFLPAWEEWLRGWTGPLLADIEHYGSNVHAVQTRTGDFGGFHEVHFRHGGVCMDAEIALSCIRLDVRRPEVRDHLVRCGCPAWARDVPVAVWCWGMGVEPREVVPAYKGYGCDGASRHAPGSVVLVSTGRPGQGWCVFAGPDCLGSGPETGPEGRACADLGALRAGCILEEPGDPRDPTKPPGWYVPLLGGGVGWWAKGAE